MDRIVRPTPLVDQIHAIALAHGLDRKLAKCCHCWQTRRRAFRHNVAAPCQPRPTAWDGETGESGPAPTGRPGGPWPNAGGLGEWGRGVRRFAPGCGVTGGTSRRPVGASGAILGDSGTQAVGLGWHGTVPSGLRRVGSPWALPAPASISQRYDQGPRCVTPCLTDCQSVLRGPLPALTFLRRGSPCGSLRRGYNPRQSSVWGGSSIG